jgi:hypothetical protein
MVLWGRRWLQSQVMHLEFQCYNMKLKSFNMDHIYYFVNFYVQNLENH